MAGDVNASSMCGTGKKWSEEILSFSHHRTTQDEDSRSALMPKFLVQQLLDFLQQALGPNALQCTRGDLDKLHWRPVLSLLRRHHFGHFPGFFVAECPSYN